MRAQSQHTASTAKKYHATASDEYKYFPFTKHFHKPTTGAAQRYSCPFSYSAINCFLYFIANVVCMEYQLPTAPLPQQRLKRSTKRKTVPLTLWVKPQLKAEIQRLAAQEGLSL